MKTFEYFLFPYTVLPESDYRHLAILLPHLHILQIAREPKIPDWEEGFFTAAPTISDEQRERVRALLQEYQNFADLIGEGTMLASMSRFNKQAAWRDSRFHIQSAIKGKSEDKDFEDSQLSLLEAASFLEVAHNLDLQGMELEQGIVNAENLEREFRNILGIAAEEDLGEFEKIRDVPLISETTYMSFMLPKRIAYWLRLFSCNTSAGAPILVTVIPEVAEEVCDPMMSIERSMESPPPGIISITLASIPSLETLSGHQFQKVVDELRQSGVLENYRKALEVVLEDPKNSSSLEQLSGHCESLRSSLGACDAASKSNLPRIELCLTLIENQTIQDLWIRFDKDGAGRTESGIGTVQGPLAILFLTETGGQ